MAPTTEIVALARTIASAHGLDPALVCAVVEQESAWDAHAIRYEPAFRAHAAYSAVAVAPSAPITPASPSNLVITVK
jgi:hypothetical protein